MHRIGRDCVRTVAIPCEDFFLYYVRTNADVANLSPRVLQAMSAAYSAVDGFDYSDFTGLRYLRRQFRVDRKVIERRSATRPPQAGEFERAQVTGEHHTHYRPEELWCVLANRGKLVRAASIILSRLRDIKGVTESVVSTFLCYVLYVRPQVAYLIACSDAIWGDASDVDLLAENLKRLSTPLKSLQRHDILDLSQLFELQVLVNRGSGQIDWNKEKHNRVEPDVVECDPARVYREARSVFKMGKRHGYQYTDIKLDKYVKSRWEWVPTGSVHSQYEQDRQYINKNYRHRTKFVTLNRMPADYIRRMFTRSSEIHAWASVKYEWAKQRAIYGVDLTSSVITNYAMYRCEEALKHRFPVGEDAEAGRVHKRLKFMLQNAESYCYDFDDFNAQHSIESMQAVLIAYMDEFRPDMTADQEAAMEWVIHSVGKMIVHNNENGMNDVYQLAGTLLSGWRLTTFMNSVLNYVYFKISGALDASGVVDSVHNGDDVLLSVRNMAAVLEIDSRMRSINARSQPAKCNAFSIGEFLRVEHKLDKTNGMGAQYLSRAAATMVHSRVESQAPLRVSEALKAYVTRAEEISARSEGSAEVSAALLEISISRLAEIFNVDASILRDMVQAHDLLGGCIPDESGRIDKKFSEEVEFREVDEAAAREAGQAVVSDLSPGIHDYAAQLAGQYFGMVAEKRVLSAVRRATVRQLAVTRSTRLLVEDVTSERKYAFGRALYKMYRRN
uniref:RNA-directed RNA polymerase n=1 Tax=Cynanchum associated totivirus TaxID=3161584 RepID=A0AAU6S474_9VIRU